MYTHKHTTYIHPTCIHVYTYIRHAVSRLGFLYKSGVDKEGRAVFVLVANRYPARDADGEKAMLHVIACMDACVHKPYVLVWVHSNFSVGVNQPLPSLLNLMYETLDRRYKKNLKWLYVVSHSHTHTHALYIYMYIYIYIYINIYI